MMRGGRGGRRYRAIKDDAIPLRVDSRAGRVESLGSTARARPIHIHGTERDEADVVAGRVSLGGRMVRIEHVVLELKGGVDLNSLAKASLICGGRALGCLPTICLLTRPIEDKCASAPCRIFIA
jgi:hypothetical protein